MIDWLSFNDSHKEIIINRFREPANCNFTDEYKEHVLLRHTHEFVDVTKHHLLTTLNILPSNFKLIKKYINDFNYEITNIYNNIIHIGYDQQVHRKYIVSLLDMIIQYLSINSDIKMILKFKIVSALFNSQLNVIESFNGISSPLLTALYRYYMNQKKVSEPTCINDMKELLIDAKKMYRVETIQTIL